MRLNRVLFVFAAVTAAIAFQAKDPDLARWEQQARNITITRDDWGIAQLQGKTDADAVFVMIYAQAEDDFNRVETNYLNSVKVILGLRVDHAEDRVGIRLALHV